MSMDVDYIVAEIAKYSANIDILNTIESVLVWVILVCGIMIVASLFIAYFVPDNDILIWCVSIGICVVILAVLSYAGAMGLEWVVTNKYDALVAAYEGLIL